jgi:hypothetical protein
MAREMTATRRWWRPRNLFLAWCGYWVALVAVTAAKPLAAAIRLTQDPNSHGDAAISFGNGVFTANISQAGQPTWTGSVSALTLTLLVAGPPLLLWLMWFVATSRTNNAEQIGANDAARAKELYATDSRTEIIESSTSARRAREES